MSDEQFKKTDGADPAEQHTPESPASSPQPVADDAGEKQQPRQQQPEPVAEPSPGAAPVQQDESAAPAGPAEPAAAEKTAGVEEPAGVEKPAAAEKTAGVEEPAPVEKPAAAEKTADAEEPAADAKPAGLPRPEVIFMMARDPFFAARITPVARSLHVPLKAISDLGLLRLETADVKHWRIVIEAKTFQKYRDMLQQLADGFPSDEINAIVVGKRQVIEMIREEMDLPPNILVIDTPIFISCMHEIIVDGRVPETRPGPEYLMSLSVESEDPRLNNDRPQSSSNQDRNQHGKGKRKNRQSRSQQSGGSSEGRNNTPDTKASDGDG